MKKRTHLALSGILAAVIALGATNRSLLAESTTAPVEVEAKVRPADPTPAPKPVPFAVSEKLTTGPELVLEAPDLDPVLAEDQARAAMEKGPMRIGIRRPLPVQISPNDASSGYGNWHTLNDGSRLWTMTTRSVGALGMRVQFEDVSLPVGATLLVFNADNSQEVCGGYNQAHLAGQKSFWSESIYGEAVTIECHVAASVAAEDLSFKVTEVTHQYVDIFKLVDQQAKAAGACNNDVTCSSAWAQTAKAVSGLGLVGQNGVLFCTGCLVADSDPNSFLNYYLTANHCIENQSRADSLEFYWFFQTSSCNGAPPSAASVPRTGGGANLLANSWSEAANDFCFLKMRQNPPGGVVYAGWSTADLGASETATVIHHPQGEYKRISFGNRQSSDLNYWTILWNDGTTEPGSSGSPLFNPSQKIIGQLFGGLASCTMTSEPDHFGRFNRTYEVISNYLMNQPITVPNDAFANAQGIPGGASSSSGNSAGATGQSGEPAHAQAGGTKSVWFKWIASGGGTATLNTQGSWFDTVLAVYTGSSVNGLALVASNDDINVNAGIVASSVSFAAQSGTTYYIAVDGFRGSAGKYTLNWNLPGPVTQNRTLTVQSNPGGANITVSPVDRTGQGSGPANFTRSYVNGTVVTLTAPVTYQGLNFAGWSGAVSSANPQIQVTMDSDKTLVATYSSPTGRTLTVQSNPTGATITVSPADQNAQGNGTTTFTRSYANGATVTLTAPTTYQGMTFAGWSGDVTGSNPTIQVPMSANRSVTANYSQPPPGLHTGPYDLQFMNPTAIWDFSGTYSTAAQGIDLDFTLAQDAKGKIVGSGHFYFSDYVQGVHIVASGPITFSGSAKGGGTSAVKVSLKMNLAGTGSAQGISFEFTGSETFSMTLDVANRRLIGPGKGKVCVKVEGHRSCESFQETAFLPIPAGMNGTWTSGLNVILTGTKITGTGVIHLSNGRAINFTDSGSWSASKGLAKFKLKGINADSSCSASFESVNIQSAVIVGRKLKGKALGITFTAP